MINEKRRNKYLLLFLSFIISFTILLFFFSKGSVYAKEDHKKVLFISSYSESFITVPDQIIGLKSVFDPEKVTLEIEYMDTKKISTKESLANFYISLKYKLNNTSAYDAIIVGDDAALQFAMDYQEELFSTIPIIFFGINDLERAKIADVNPYLVGSVEQTSLVETIEIAHRFNPHAKKVVAITDNTLTGEGDRKQFKEAGEQFDNLDFDLLNVSDYTFQEFSTMLESVDEETILLFLNMSQDNTGLNINLDEQISILKSHTNVPIYRVSVGGVGDGLIGGKMINYEELGANAANMVMDIFSGTSIASINMMEETPYYYIFDYDLIKKYDINEKLIPKGSILINKNIHPLEKYKKYLVGIGIIMAVLILVSLILIIDNFKRRKIQKELRESNEELTSIYEELTASEEELKMQYDTMEQHAKEVNALYQKYDIAIQSTDSAVWELNLETLEIEISENFSMIVNKPIQTNENVHKMIENFIHPEYREGLICEMRRYINKEIIEINIEVPMNMVDGLQSWILIRGKGILDIHKEMKKISGIFLDITKKKEQEEFINYSACHDFLTGLPNRMKFMDMLSSKLSLGETGSVLLLDIDNFKSINDTLGHVYGDEVLKKIAERLDKICNRNMFVARLGGDEFLILLLGITEFHEVSLYANRIKDAFVEVISLQGIENYITFSMGITRYPMDTDNIIQLIMNADTAMYAVKNNDKNNYVFYREDMKDQLKFKIEMESLLREAMKDDGFTLQYQPQIDTFTGNIIGFEALLRLKKHSISPAVFIPIAEETGHIIEIGRWVAKEVISQIAKLKEKGFQEKMFAINYSSKQLRDIGYVDYLKELLEEYKVESKYIEIEITESILLENNTKTLEFLHDLKGAGFQIALDDFGTGYSSLNYLTYITVDKIKLDKSINDKFLDLADTKVMDSLISLAHSLNLKITAEGIEEWDKFMKLRYGGCDFIQGFLFSKPLCIGEIEKIYNTNLMEKMRP
ncbi:MAG TPA: EAL domain-containing protein [Lachnospiraceae bacterium]|nr:EAL domain-containing protein [Lachnospiraceae bacterium]